MHGMESVELQASCVEMRKSVRVAVSCGGQVGSSCTHAHTPGSTSELVDPRCGCSLSGHLAYPFHRR